MKTMTCNQLAGACEEKFTAATFEEIAEMSKKHGMAMFAKGDQPHLDAMQAMKAKMSDPADFQKWMTRMREAFDALPED